MDTARHTDEVTQCTDAAKEPDPFQALEEELTSALSWYWSTAAAILRGSGIDLLDPSPDYYRLENNFFSALFLYSYQRANIPKHRRFLYAAVNQCLRGMVTGCDNILDDEYKKTLDTDLPARGTRFRSILDIMVSDRVLFEILLRSCHTDGLTFEQVLAASSASLRGLTKSGAQEAAEEDGVDHRLEPDEVLRTVHHFKTGVLFQCPWAVPAVIEDLSQAEVAGLMDGLYRIGMGCQIMDDMVDLAADIMGRRHNYVASLIYHNPDPNEWPRLKARLATDLLEDERRNLLFDFDHARIAAAATARYFLETGVRALYAEHHQHLVEHTISFLGRRIRAHRFITDFDSRCSTP